MKRAVRADDRRNWTVQSRISWTKPGTGEEFEHDMAGGYVSGVAMLGVIVVLTLFVVFWTPAGVVVPAWFVLLLLLLLLLLPVSWATQRPWIITAHTQEPAGTGGERWEAVVRGVGPAREEAFRIVDELQTTGVLEDGNGALRRISSPTHFHDS
jgi:hypothetical protein